MNRLEVVGESADRESREGVSGGFWVGGTHWWALDLEATGRPGIQGDTKVGEGRLPGAAWRRAGLGWESSARF